MVSRIRTDIRTRFERQALVRELEGVAAHSRAAPQLRPFKLQKRANSKERLLNFRIHFHSGQIHEPGKDLDEQAFEFEYLLDAFFRRLGQALELNWKMPGLIIAVRVALRPSFRKTRSPQWNDDVGSGGIW